MNYKIIEDFNNSSNVYKVYNNRFLCDESECNDKNEFILSPIQNNIVHCLYSTGDKTVGELARVESASRYYISNGLKGLLKEGIIERYQKSDNLRYIYLKLTEKGRNFWEKCNIKTIGNLNRILSSIATEDEVKQMTEHFAYINQILGRLDKDSEFENYKSP